MQAISAANGICPISASVPRASSTLISARSTGTLRSRASFSTLRATSLRKVSPLRSTAALCSSSTASIGRRSSMLRSRGAYFVRSLSKRANSGGGSTASSRSPSALPRSLRYCM